MSVSYGEMATTLIKIANETNAAEVHISTEKIEAEDGIAIVMSAYKGVKPAHIVLNEVYEWAEQNNVEVAQMIRDMQGNEE